jgi:hypothetical protein
VTHVKHDKGKPRFTLMPGARAWAPVVAVLQWAVDVKGYPANNWQNAPSTDRYRDAFARHFAAWQDDPRGVDAESGLSHLSHAVCNGLFLLWHRDDQPAPVTPVAEPQRARCTYVHPSGVRCMTFPAKTGNGTLCHWHK